MINAPECSGALLLRLLDAYAVRYGEMLDGRSESLPTSELAGGARIRHIFQDIFVEGVGELNPSRYAFSSLVSGALLASRLESHCKICLWFSSMCACYTAI